MAQQQLALPPELQKKLNSLECPFNWVNVFTADDLHVMENDFHSKTREKLDNSNDDDFIEYGFPSGLCLIYEYIVRRDARDRVMEIINTCEAKLKSVFENKRNYRLLRKWRLAFTHVLQGCKAYFECHYGNMSLLQDVLKVIPDHNKFNSDIQACVNGIKASFLLAYGPYRTTEVGVQCAKKAIELDSTEGWYYFLVGKGLYRHRRIMNRDAHPSEEEIDFMERARQLECEKSDKYLIEMYSEMIEKGKFRENYLDKAAQLCRNIYEGAEHWKCLWRCARGLNRIHKLDQQNTNLMEQCLDKANIMSPNNPEILFLYSKFFQHKKHNLLRALHYAQLATKFGGAMPMYVIPLLRLMYMKDHSKDLVPAFDEFISKAETAFNRHVFMCVKARYLLQRKRNFKIVLEIFAQVLREDPECLRQEEAKRNKELNHLLRVLFPDIQVAVKMLHYKDERDYCESRLAEMKKFYPDLVKIKPLQPKRKEWWNTYYNVYN